MGEAGGGEVQGADGVRLPHSRMRNPLSKRTGQVVRRGPGALRCLSPLNGAEGDLSSPASDRQEGGGVSLEGGGGGRVADRGRD